MIQISEATRLMLLILTAPSSRRTAVPISVPPSGVAVENSRLQFRYDMVQINLDNIAVLN
jgi:hypothetical protein